MTIRSITCPTDELHDFVYPNEGKKSTRNSIIIQKPDDLPCYNPDIAKQTKMKIDYKKHLKVAIIALLALAFFWFLWYPWWQKLQCERHANRIFAPSYICPLTQKSQCDELTRQNLKKNAEAIQGYVDECLMTQGLK